MNANRNTKIQNNNIETNKDLKRLGSPRAKKLIAGVVGAGMLLSACNNVSNDESDESYSYACGPTTEQVVIEPGSGIRAVLSEIPGALIPSEEVPVGERAEDQPNALATRAIIARANLPEIYNTPDMHKELDGMLEEFAEVESGVSQDSLEAYARRLSTLEMDYIHPNATIQIPAGVCRPTIIVDQ